MFSSHGLVSSIQITVLEDEDHITPSGREPFPLTTAISVGRAGWYDSLAMRHIYVELHLPVRGPAEHLLFSFGARDRKHIATNSLVFGIITQDRSRFEDCSEWILNSIHSVSRVSRIGLVHLLFDSIVNGEQDGVMAPGESMVMQRSSA